MDGTVTFLRWPETKDSVYLGDIHIEIDGEDMGLIQDEDVSFLLADGPQTVRMYHMAGLSPAEARITLNDGDHLMVCYRPALAFGQKNVLMISGYNPVSAEKALREITDFSKRDAAVIKLLISKVILGLLLTFCVILIFVIAYMFLS